MNTHGSQIMSFDQIAYASARMDLHEFCQFAYDFNLAPEVIHHVEECQGR